MNDHEKLLDISRQLQEYLTLPQAESCRDKVTRLYREVLHREPDPGGLDFWTGRCEAGVPEAEIRAVFLSTITATIPPPPPPAQPPPGGNPSAIVAAVPFGVVIAPNIHPSGEVRAYPVMASPSGRSATALTQGQTPNTGAHTTTEVQVSRTPGVFDLAARTYRTTTQNFNAFTIYGRIPPGLTPEALLAEPTAFYAPEPGPWYVNVRWTTPSGRSGFSMQWGEGPQ